ncbi:hypothetical protein [Streptomyces sp. NBC_00005]|uniref:hypothetical protein n=1 Tax=Streptomyces sp. NBC_00005 TaxID=2903609 RepID=UPI00324531B9
MVTQPMTGPSRAVNMVLTALSDSVEGTLFAPQARALTGLDDRTFEAAVAELDECGQIVVERHHAPDPHLQGDWRSLSLVRPGKRRAQAAAAGRAHFDRWVREFLQQHRCT